MSFQFGFGWAKSDPNDLCMREERNASEFSSTRKSISNQGAFILRITMDEDATAADPNNVQSYEMDGDFEQISTQMVCRFLIKCPGCVVFPRGGFPELSTNASNSMLSVTKNKIDIRLKRKPTHMEEEQFSPEDVLCHSIMFQAFHALLDRGYQAFSTEDQLRGVVSRKVENNMLEVCALRNCVINHQEGDGRINIEVFRYKFTPLKIEDLSLYPLEDAWSRTAVPVQCVFLPTQEEVHLLAVTTYRAPTPASPGATAAYESRLLLTALDFANRARGFSTYLPETYEKTRQYWELAYGFVLPRVPDGVLFGRIQTALGEQIVPLQVLVRGVVEVPWKNFGDPLACATRVYHCLQHRIPQLRSLHPPQHPDDLARQLRAAFEPTSGGNSTSDVVASLSGRPPKTLFVSALRMKNAQIAHTTPRMLGPLATATATTTEPPPYKHVNEDEDEGSGGLFDEGEDFFADSPKQSVRATKPLPSLPPPLRAKVASVHKTLPALASGSVKPVLITDRAKTVLESVTVAPRSLQGVPRPACKPISIAGATNGVQRSNENIDEDDDKDDTASLSQDLSDSSQSSLLCTPPEDSGGAGASASASASASGPSYARPAMQSLSSKRTYADNGSVELPTAPATAAVKRKAAPAPVTAEKGGVVKKPSRGLSQKPATDVHSERRRGDHVLKAQSASKGKKGGKK